MNLKHIFYISLLLWFSHLNGQKNRFFKNVSIEFSTGIQYNFYADLNLPLKKENGFIQPRPLEEGNGIIFDQKNAVGTFVNLDLKYRLNQIISLGLGFTHTSNWGKYDFIRKTRTLNIEVDHMRPRNINHFYYVFLSGNIGKKFPTMDLGFYFLKPHYQEIIIRNNYFELRNRSGRNYNELNTWGLWIGTQYIIYNTPLVSFGFNGKFYFSIPEQRSENLIVTPFISYHF